MPTRLSKWHLSVLSSLLVVVAFSCAAFAQFEKGAVSGTVSDSTGAVVVGGQVAVTSTDTGAVRTATTDNTGGFTVTGLAPGPYEIKVSHTGFGDFKQRFTISPGVHTSLDAVLSPRGTETIVEVTGRAETQVDTQTSSINQVVDSTRVSQLPSLTRNPYDFVQTMGNVNQDSASGTGGMDQVARALVFRSTANARPAPTPCSTAVRTSTSTPQKSDRRFRSIRSRNLALTAITSRRNTDGLRVV